MDLAQFWFQAAGGPAPVVIGNSLRFRGAQKLSRTNGPGGNLRTFTQSFWVKRAGTTTDVIFEAWGGTTNWSTTTFSAGLLSQNRVSGTTYGINTANVGINYRDPGAWYHIVVSYSNAVPTLYVNGSAVSTTNNNTSEWHFLRNGYPLTIGARSTNDEFLDGYLSEIHFVDGQALAPTDFGEFNADGVWVPKKVEGVTYGSNGFYLAFDDVTNIGKDSSGNGNDFTATGFELTTTTSSNYDWVADSPTDNYATGNPLLKEASGDEFWREGNLRRGATTIVTSTYTIEVPRGCKVYLESEAEIGQGVYAPRRADISSQFNTSNSDFYGVNDTGDKFLAGARSSYMPGFGSTDVLGMWIDRTNNTLGFVDKNGTLHGSIGTLPDVDVWQIALAFRVGDAYFNSGTRPFKHSVPTGFEPLSTAGLPAVAIKNPSDHFSTILDTGANILTAAQAKFPNGLWWIKDRTGSNQHQLVDSIRGNQAWQCPGLGDATYAAPSGNSVAWCWNAPETFTADGSGGAQGSKAVTGRRNVDAGFSMGQWTQQYSASGGDTLAHGLSQPPEFFFVKGETNQVFYVYHSALGPTKGLRLNGSNAESTSTGLWNNTAPDGNVLTVGTNYTNYNNNPSMFYAWHSVPGYSSFGSYSGASGADGSFIYTGFRIGWLMIKRTNTSSSSWYIFDNQRNTYNPVQHYLRSNLEDPEDASQNLPIDFLSNGFKCRTGSGYIDDAGDSYMYIAFAEHCFGGSNVSPAPAR